MKSIELKRGHSLLNKQIWMLNQMYILVEILNLCSKAYPVKGED